MNKKEKQSNSQNESGYNYFLLKTKGYKKQFTNELSARRKFAKLEKDKTDAEEPFKIELFGRKDLNSDWTELDFVQISDFE